MQFPFVEEFGVTELISPTIQLTGMEESLVVMNDVSNDFYSEKCMFINNTATEGSGGIVY